MDSTPGLATDVIVSPYADVHSAQSREVSSFSSNPPRYDVTGPNSKLGNVVGIFVGGNYSAQPLRIRFGACDLHYLFLNEYPHKESKALLILMKT